jgi:hypothetical protein
MYQKRTLARLFDHLVGDGEQLAGNLEAKRLGGGQTNGDRSTPARI